MWWIPVGIVAGLILLVTSSEDSGGSGSPSQQEEEARKSAKRRAEAQERQEARERFRRTRSKEVREFLVEYGIAADCDRILSDDPSLRDLRSRLAAAVHREQEDPRLKQEQERIELLRHWKTGIQAVRRGLQENQTREK